MPTNRAAVYLYRPGSLGAALSPNVVANGVVLAPLPVHGYFVYDAAPGELTLTQHTEATTSVTLDVKTGETYYVKGSMGMGFFVGHPHLVIVSKDVAESEIKDCKLVPGTIPSAETVAAGPPTPAGQTPPVAAGTKSQ
ncbi:MAG TPA: DUF2846 domain-containing protein [Steroidobacteraceae bacterium]